MNYFEFFFDKFIPVFSQKYNFYYTYKYYLYFMYSPIYTSNEYLIILSLILLHTILYIKFPFYYINLFIWYYFIKINWYLFFYFIFYQKLPKQQYCSLDFYKLVLYHLGCNLLFQYFRQILLIIFIFQFIFICCHLYIRFNLLLNIFHPIHF